MPRADESSASDPVSPRREERAPDPTPGKPSEEKPPEPRADSLAERLRGLYGEGVDPAICLDASESPRADASAEIVRRLNARGRPFGRYTLKDEIARGGQGSVLRVWDEDLRRSLAMKLILTKEEKKGHQPQGADTRSLGRFLEEAQVTGQLDHPGIVPVHELGLDSAGRVYFTMKLVRGQDLKAVFRQVHAGEPDWNVTRALGVLLKVCEAMAYAHSKGVIHRDLKPANVMVGRFGEVYVMDWGLARILGRPDARDVRIKDEELMTQQVDVRRWTDAVHESDAPLVTMDGDVVGTPAYMSPEQAAGDLEAMGAHSDVYSAGAMLYHLLARQMPYVPPTVRLSNYAIWARVQEGPPTPLHVLAPEQPAELVAICEKAMARKPSERYRDMSELAEDLRAFLEHRVVHAYETGALAELRKWMRRNRALAGASAAALVLALGGLGLVGWVEARGRRLADEQRELADDNARRADDNAGRAERQAEVARQERANVLRLSALADLEELERAADGLWPPTPARVGEYEDWLARARALVARLEPDPATGEPGFRARLSELRAHALPEDGAAHEAARRAEPRYAELVALDARRSALRRAQALRQRGAGRDARALQADFLRATPDLPEDHLALNQMAWPLVRPDRKVFGREEQGLVLALTAFERARDEEQKAEIGDTLAWGYFANGMDDQAVEASAAALELAPPQRRAEFEGYLAAVEQRVERADAELVAELAELDRARAGLAAELDRVRAWSFADEEVAWWHALLAKLVTGLEQLSDEEHGLMGQGTVPGRGWSVPRRLAFARAVEAETVGGPEAAARWVRAAASIADARECPAYRGLLVRPQLGLVPLGRDPASGLWEFVLPQSGTAPERGAAGLALTPASGLVLVLLPGGTVLQGAQPNPGRAHYDPGTLRGETPVHPVVLPPFFLSKYEMTQEQWTRLTGVNPSFHQGLSFEMHPVEALRWGECVEALAWAGLRLPSEAEWEYGTRAGTDTPWWTGREPGSLAGAANLAGDNPNPMHAPVGRLRANAFGLHDVHGNVWEMCLDAFNEDFYEKVDAWSPLDDPTGAELFVARGGIFDSSPEVARSAYRLPVRKNYLHHGVGVRPARALER